MGALGGGVWVLGSCVRRKMPGISMPTGLKVTRGDNWRVFHHRGVDRSPPFEARVRVRLGGGILGVEVAGGGALRLAQLAHGGTL